MSKRRVAVVSTKLPLNLYQNNTYHQELVTIVSGSLGQKVTGANKGIGFAIVRALCKQFDGDVYLTARNEDLGRKAVQQLEKENLYPKFHLLDVTNMDSIKALRDFIEQTYGGLDVLVNNAGVAILNHSFEEGEKTIQTNYISVIRLSEVLFPLLRQNARVVNVSGRQGNFVVTKMDEGYKSKFSAPDLTIEQLTSLVWEYYKFIFQDPNFDNKIYNNFFAYGVSKLALTRLTTILQRQLSSDSRNIIINAGCPGFVDTDLTKLISLNLPKITPDESADTPVYLALLPTGTTSPAGQLIYKRAVINWDEFVL